MKAARTAIRNRPMPPDIGGIDQSYFAPAPEVATWVKAHLLDEEGALFNPDHKHLQFADIGFLWAAQGFTSKQRTVVGTAEAVMFRCSAWQKLRQEQQMQQWFGHVPDWLITLDARYSAQASDAAFCALVEHELYHIAHARDEWGSPAYYRDSGLPKLCLQGHDVEEFVGIVRRYGVAHGAGRTAELVAAAKRKPEVAESAIVGACGTCMLRVA